MASAWSSTIRPASAQSASPPEAPETGVVLVKLSSPVYPESARQASIQGDVEVAVGVLRNGRVVSAVIASGDPILARAALESPQESQFDCHECGASVTSYRLRYKFQITAHHPPSDCDPRAETQPSAEMDASRHQITVPPGGCGPVTQAAEYLKFVPRDVCTYGQVAWTTRKSDYALCTPPSPSSALAICPTHCATSSSRNVRSPD